MLDRTELIPVHDGERRRIGPFDCEFIPVTHSVPHALRHRVPHARGHDPAHRRLQARPHAGRRPQDRPRAARRDRQARAAACSCCSPTRRTPSGPGSRRRSRRSGDTMRTLFRDYPDQRFIVAQLRVAPAPGAAGRRGRRSPPAARSRSSAARWCNNVALGARDGHARHPRRARDRHRGGAALRARRGVHHLHRLAGRADERALADGRARAQVREGQRATTSS